MAINRYVAFVFNKILEIVFYIFAGGSALIAIGIFCVVVFLIIYACFCVDFEQINKEQINKHSISIPAHERFNQEYSDVVSLSRNFLIEELHLRIKHRLALRKLLAYKSGFHKCPTNTTYFASYYSSLDDDIASSIAAYACLTVYSNKVDDTRFYFSYPYF